MVRLIIAFALSLLATSPAAAASQATGLASPQTPLPIVERSSDRSKVIMLGFMAVGSKADMNRIDKAAVAAGLKAARAKNHLKQKEVMIMFVPPASREAAVGFYRQARAGRFGTFAFEVMIAPIPAEVSLFSLDSAEIFPPESIAEPAP